MSEWLILVINPGSTSTKVAVYKNEKEIIQKTLRHDAREFSAFENIAAQYGFRESVIFDFLKENNITADDFNAVVGRGGLLTSMEGGTYRVSRQMCDFLMAARGGEHASNLGAVIAKPIADKIGVDAYIVDPVVVDEMEPVSRISGHPLFVRRSVFHALNQKAVARLAAAKLKKKYEECNFVVAHLGGGISVGVHKKGRVVDVNNALDGEGPFSPERSGTLPSGQLASLCFSGKYNESQVFDIIRGKGGLVGYLGTNDLEVVDERIKNGDNKAKLALEAMIYQVAKEIGACAVALRGNIDRIIITGGISFNKSIVSKIKEYIDFIAPVEVYPGEEELLSLALGCLRVLNFEENAKEFFENGGI
ncbi:MAG: butyrate kinase [Oligoflexia bacterium]|nr:butyrate kinase [Oligoflexia bacterium]